MSSTNLTVRHSSPKGRLGNHMFQYAIIKAISIKYGHKIYWKDLLLSKIFTGIKDESKVVGSNELIISEPESGGTRYHEINDNIKTRNVCVDGYRQSWKYFEDINDELKIDFSFHQDIEHDVKKILDPIKNSNKDKQLVIIQVRRDDYLKYPGYLSPTKENIINGINYMKSKYDAIFIFVSDGIKWCKENFSSIENTYFSEGHSDAFDMCLIKNSDHGLISSSTFGWWGMYLNTNEKKEFFGLSEYWFDPKYPKMGNRDTTGLLLPGFKLGIPTETIM